ncbi:ABC transporter substrate-binding protein [Pelagibius sp. Alg239-R121]|uniref:ABC transporter substrate-binding protein n=1 Tax=Pelagibius sp. Alg239-R121 TaxID=2993448 RepID=UPI0024A61888|nr:ABC transporter substrate-binding protein [Pelagibius sp. Alg239-R121]
MYKALNGLAAAVAAMALSLSLTLAASAETITITDTEGREVVVPHGAERVLLTFYFEDFYAIVGKGAYDRVVAISREPWEGWRNTQFQVYSKAIPRITGLIDVGYEEAGGFSIEKAVAAKPDVAIIASWQYRGLGAEGIAKLEAAGIPIVVTDYNAQTLEKHLASTRIIGQVMASEARAEKLADEYEAAVLDVIQRVKSRGNAPAPVYVELGNKGPGTYGNSYGPTMWGGVVKMAGGQNIAESKIENWGPLNPEYVLASKPKTVFLAGSDWAGRDKAVLMGFGIEEDVTRARIQPYVKRPGWSNLPAVQEGEIHAVYHGGARTLYDYTFLQYIAKVLHPKAFTDVDPVANHKRFYETYLPIEAEGSFMLKLD